MTNGIALVFTLTNLCLTNFHQQIQPWLTNQVVNGTAELTTIIGQAILLEWAASTNTVLVQESANLTEWADIRVLHIGATNWWVLPLAQQRFYRLRIEP